MDNNRKPFFFKCRMPIEDWELLEQGIRKDCPHLYHQGDNPQGRIRDWTVNRLTDFCKQIAVPLLREPLAAPRRSKNPDVTLLIPEIELTNIGATNLEILKDFANFKNSSMATIVRNYIITPYLLEEEARICRTILQKSM